MCGEEGMSFVRIRNTRREIDVDFDFYGEEIVSYEFMDDLDDWELTPAEVADIADQLAEQDFDRRHQ
jgi:hypothetical protein